MQLIKVSKNEQGQQVVNARNLWKFLDVNSDFFTWIKKLVGLIAYLFYFL